MTDLRIKLYDAISKVTDLYFKEVWHLQGGTFLRNFVREFVSTCDEEETISVSLDLRILLAEGLCERIVYGYPEEYLFTKLYDLEIAGFIDFKEKYKFLAYFEWEQEVTKFIDIQQQQ